MATLLPSRFMSYTNSHVVASWLDEPGTSTGVDKNERPINGPFNQETVFGGPTHWSAAPLFSLHAWAQPESGDEDGYSAAETKAVHRGGSRSPRGRGLM